MIFTPRIGGPERRSRHGPTTRPRCSRGLGLVDIWHENAEHTRQAFKPSRLCSSKRGPDMRS
jgi:hypothetical protein